MAFLKLSSAVGAGPRRLLCLFYAFRPTISSFLSSQAGEDVLCFRTGQVLVHFELGNMKSSFHVVLFFLLGLVASMALPRRQAQAQFAVVDFSGKAVSNLAK